MPWSVALGAGRKLLLAAVFAATLLVAVPARAGAPPFCPDYTGDGIVTTADLLVAVDSYFGAKPGGGIFTIADILQVVERYGEVCV